MIASTEHCSLPSRRSVLSARSPSTRPRAPMTMDCWPRFTGHGVVARPKLDRQVIDKGEVFDAEIGQHVPVARECEKRLLLRQTKECEI